MKISDVRVDVNPDEAGVFDLVFEHKGDNERTPGGMDVGTWAELAKSVKALVPFRDDYQLVGYQYCRDDKDRWIQVTGYKPESMVGDTWNVYLDEKE